MLPHQLHPPQGLLSVLESLRNQLTNPPIPRQRAGLAEEHRGPDPGRQGIYIHETPERADIEELAKSLRHIDLWDKCAFVKSLV